MVSSKTNILADPLFIASTFDLTPAEANLAAALVNGQDLKQISTRRDVSLETVRTQLKSVS